MSPGNEGHGLGGVSSPTGGYRGHSVVRSLKHERLGLGLLLVAFLALYATTVVVPGARREEALPQVIAQPLAESVGKK
jgi:hypothetical protein